MKKVPISMDPNMKNGYIPAPYVLEEGDQINDFYLEPVLFHNENGPTIGVTTCGVIVQEGLYFKDMDNDGIQPRGHRHHRKRDRRCGSGNLRIP